jgi:hypothetical protein
VNPWDKRVHPLSDDPIRSPLPCQCAQFDSVLEKNWKKGIGQCVFEFRQSRARFFFGPRGSFMGARGRSRKKKDKKLKKTINPLHIS